LPIPSSKSFILCSSPLPVLAHGHACKHHVVFALLPCLLPGRHLDPAQRHAFRIHNFTTCPAWSECPSTCAIMRLVGVSFNLYNHAPGRSVLQSVQSCAWSECPSTCTIMRLVGVSFNLCNHAPGRSVLQPVQSCAWSECPSICAIMRLVGVSFNLCNHAPGLLSCHSKMARSETCGQHIFALAVCCHCLQLHVCKVSSHTRFSFTFYEPNSTLPWL